MLEHLSVRNFVIVDELELDFTGGLSVVTGESGAGKTILINALGLVLGERGSPNLIRENNHKAEINAIFNIGNIPVAVEWLKQRELYVGDDCILRRTLADNGTSRAFINGTAATLPQIKELASMLVSLQGQHAHQVLLRRQYHCDFLDDYGGLSEQAGAYKLEFAKLRTMQKELRDLRGLDKTDARSIELLEHEVAELKQHAVGEKEYNEMWEEHNLLSNAGDILGTARDGLAILQGGADDGVGGGGADGGGSGGGAGARSGLLQAVSQLSALVANSKDKKLNEFGEQINNAEITLKDLEAELSKYASKIDLDPNRLSALDETLGALHDLARKHDTTPDKLLEFAEKHEQKLQDIKQLDARVAQKEQEIEQQEKKCRELAARLTEKRKLAGKEFDRKILHEMQGLEMTGNFATAFTPAEGISAAGDSVVEFLMSPSPAAKLMPLKNIASGGELSRATLAINKIVALNSALPCLIFDEADSGIGGKTAAKVGQSLAELGGNAQVICITHQPQTAVYGAHHYAVVKSRQGLGIVSNIKQLDEQDRQAEIARMVSGEDLGADAMNYATKLLEQARHYASKAG